MTAREGGAEMERRAFNPWPWPGGAFGFVHANEVRGAARVLLEVSRLFHRDLVRLNYYHDGPRCVWRPDSLVEIEATAIA